MLINWKQKIRFILEQTHSLNRLIKHSSEEARIKYIYKKTRDNIVKNKTNKLENERILNWKTKEKHFLKTTNLKVRLCKRNKYPNLKIKKKKGKMWTLGN